MDRLLRFLGLCRLAHAEKQIWILQCQVARQQHEINKLRYDVGNYSAACKGYRQQLSRLDEQIIH